MGELMLSLFPGRTIQPNKGRNISAKEMKQLFIGLANPDIFWDKLNDGYELAFTIRHMLNVSREKQGKLSRDLSVNIGLLFDKTKELYENTNTWTIARITKEINEIIALAIRINQNEH